jgi:hypothetical protein
MNHSDLTPIHHLLIYESIINHMNSMSQKTYADLCIVQRCDFQSSLCLIISNKDLLDEEGRRGIYSHSIVPGGFDV